MCDEELSNYFPKFGDRIAIKAYCNLQSNTKKQSDCEPTPSCSGENILQRLRAHSAMPHNTEKLKGNRNAAKTSRRVEMGLATIKEKSIHQVKTSKGGGVRHLICEKKTLSMQEVMSIAQDTLFIEGKNRI